MKTIEKTKVRAWELKFEKIKAEILAPKEVMVVSH